MHCSTLVDRFLYPSVLKWIPSFEVTFCNPSSRSGRFAVGLQFVTQQESITLKFVKPAWTRCFIRSLRKPMKPVNSVIAKFSSFALVQWALSLQHRENNPRGRGGYDHPRVVTLSPNYRNCILNNFFLERRNLLRLAKYSGKIYFIKFSSKIELFCQNFVISIFANIFDVNFEFRTTTLRVKK
jgi:hypothetical protein